ncbi:sigma-70 family RNA polymerase sigma factor [Nocardioides sp. L-11A]|uniref:sigma-70 family RNA polymerase sigma factor n=1 Tax=Nocardioides sp. L-11A TaxID=3043848 RepID=UPI00249B4FC8|nr:sigma-70 family RNA polymerase sigma factor [Nocardioides sp. L-11A]
MPTDLPDDNALLRRAHDGDAAALEALYADNVASARRLAVILAGPSAAEDLVADAFARVLARIRAGEGPVTNFRGYLFATIRNRHRDLLRRSGREAPVSDEPWLLESPTESVEEQVQELDEGAAVAALGSLPDRWQRVLWHLEVEGHQVPEVATMLSMSPAAVSSLAYRAREGLKVAYLEHHLPTAAGTRPCAWVRERLGTYVRGGLGTRAGARLDAHLTTCAACSAAAADLQHVNRKLAGLVLPVLLLGGAGAGLLDAVGAAGGGSGPGETAGTTTAAGGAGAAGAAAAAGAVAAGAGAGGGAGRGAARGTSGPGRLVRLLTGRGAAVTGAGAGGSTLVALAAAALVLVLVAVTWWAVAGSDDATDPTADHPDAATGRPTAPADTGAGPDATDPATAGTTDPATDPATDGTSDGTTPAAGPRESTGQTTGATAAAAPGPRTGSAPATDPAKLGVTRAAPPVAVRPSAPSATAIGACGSYGALTLPQTEGVDYVLTQGDGKQGAWEVTGTPRRGYVLAADAQQRFDGDLGTYYACPALGTLTVTDLGGGDWRLTAPVSATGPGSYRLTAAVSVGSDTYVPAGGVSGAGWTCWGPNPGDPQIGAGSGFMLPAGFTMDCRFDYTGAAPPDLAVVMTPVTVGPPPAGSVALTADGTSRGSASY